MLNLLSEGFARLFKSKLLYVMLLIYFIFCFVEFAGIHYIIEYLPSSDYILFSFHDIILLCVLIVAGKFVSSDFTNNTIRYKITGGYTRTQIYMSNWIISVFIGLFYLFVTQIFAMTVGFAMVGKGDFPSDEYPYYLMLSALVLIEHLSCILFMVTLMKKFSGAVFTYLFYIMSPFVASIIIIFSSNEQTVDLVEKFVEDFFPLFQSDILTSQADIPKYPHNILMPIYDAAVTIISIFGGIFVMKRSDIK